jgi:hypothetical protein
MLFKDGSPPHNHSVFDPWKKDKLMEDVCLVLIFCGGGCFCYLCLRIIL